MAGRIFTPRDIMTRKFTKNVLGYSASEVVAFLEEVSNHYEGTLKQIQEMEKKQKELQEELQSWKNKEREIYLLRENVLKETEMIREQAMQDAQRHFREVEEKANEIRLKTEKWLEEVIAEVESAEQQKISFVTAFRSALDSHYAILGKDSAGESLSLKLQNFLKTTHGREKGEELA